MEFCHQNTYTDLGSSCIGISREFYTKLFYWKAIGLHNVYSILMKKCYDILNALTLFPHKDQLIESIISVHVETLFSVCILSLRNNYGSENDRVALFTALLRIFLRHLFSLLSAL